ncbi:hypothetical protein HHK36_015204 [Tetracentron sinense]|uniref:Uncharacterized protein n=1 Tax=Tetracentron sinense TaxID=13715 RepID=A0A834Z0D7_TETSI|nr:hypothetical protein HHK36_015204 [Tetracentron sinense]
MGLYALCFAGSGFILIGAWEALVSSYARLNPSSSPPPNQTTRTKPFFSSVSSFAIALFSVFFIINSIFSLIDALNSNDRVGLPLQLEIIATASLFLLYSIASLLIDFSDSLPLPSSILNLIAFFAFVQEFLLFYLQRKDPSGIENRYFDLLLVPITVCIFSTLLELGSPKSNFPRLARGVGLILQGTWFIQMGFSFFSNLMAHGCSFHGKSRGNYTVKCKGHPEYHRGRAIATLQFNCHLALLVVLIVGVYSIIAPKYRAFGNYMNYRPLGSELQQLDNQTQFTLDSDDEDDGEIKEEENVEKQKAAVLVSASGVNGYGSH